MDQYIRDFVVDTIESYSLQQCSEAKQILQINKNTHNFKILHNNIRSINRNLDEFKIFLSELDSNIDVIILTETWKIVDLSLYNIEGYDIIYNNGDYNQNDGTVVYVKSKHQYLYTVQQIYNTKALNIRIKLEKNDIIITAVYRSPNTDPYEFNRELENYFKTIDTNKKNEYYMFVGDINIDLLQNYDYVKEYQNILHESGYISTINNVTRSQGNQNSCIDHIFIKSKHNSKDLPIIPLIINSNITDHLTIILQLILNYKDTSQERKSHFKIINYKKLDQFLSTVTWDTIYSEDNIDAATNKFVNIIINAINSCTTFKRTNRKNYKKTPWITNGLIKSVHKKNLMFKNLQKDPNNTELKESYKNYKNKLSALIYKTKNNYYRNEINKNATDSKSIWKVIQGITNSKSKLAHIESIKNKDGEVLTETKCVANEFVKTFTEMGKILANNINKDPNFSPERTQSRQSFFLLPTDKIEIKNIISNLKNNKSTGVDLIKAETLKAISKYITDPFVFIINKCMEVGLWPSAFKLSVITPIHKNGDKSQVQNYRPISQITTLAKIFEKVLKVRLNSYLKKFNILSDKQYGFKEGVSTQDAIIDLTTNIYLALDGGNPCLCTFIDLSKAFDTVSHDLLLQTLEGIGFRGTSLNFFKSYLANRPQSVRVNNELSESLNIEYGVPQGTVLGPLLFSIYVNEMFTLQNSGKIISFADDTAIFHKADTWSELKNIVETDLSTLKNWFDYKLLTLNFEKSFYLPFSCNKAGLPSFDQLNINTLGTQRAILPKTEIKYLGIIIDQHLRWESHVNYIIKKLQFILYKFKFLKNILNIQQMKVIYHSLVESHINYAILGWGGVAKTHLYALELLQKRFLRLMLHKDNRYPSELLYLEARLFDIRQIFYFSVNMKKHQKRNINMYPTHFYNTRQKDKCLHPLMLKTIGQRSYHYLAPKLYNTVPDEIRNIRSIPLFKKKLKIYILEQNRKMFSDYIDLK